MFHNNYDIIMNYETSTVSRAYITRIRKKGNYARIAIGGDNSIKVIIRYYFRYLLERQLSID